MLFLTTYLDAIYILCTCNAQRAQASLLPQLHYREKILDDTYQPTAGKHRDTVQLMTTRTKYTYLRRLFEGKVPDVCPYVMFSLSRTGATPEREALVKPLSSE